MAKRKALFDSDDEAEEELSVNNNYAKKYVKWRQGEELQKLKDRYGEDVSFSSSESDTSDDEFINPDNPEFDKDFLKTLGYLHGSSPDMSHTNFFKEKYNCKVENKEQEKPMTLKDFERHVIVERGGVYEDEEEDSSSLKKEQPALCMIGGPTGNKSPVIKFDDGEDESDEEELVGGLFKARPKADVEKTCSKEPGNDALEFIKGSVAHLASEDDEELLLNLQKKWSDPNLSVKEKWLVDFFVNKRYLDESDEESKCNPHIFDPLPLSEDEEVVTKLEDFETKYRFRFQEPGEELIKSYPRDVQSSRMKDDRRAVKRVEKMQKKKDNKERKRNEINQLKALKKKEILDKIQKIKEASGTEALELLNDDLDGDFDPNSHDNLMLRTFSDDFYLQEVDAEKPVFPEEDDEEDIRDYDDWLDRYGMPTADGEEGEVAPPQDCAGENQGADGLDDSADYAGNDQQPSKSCLRRMQKRMSKFRTALARKKPVFDPVEKDFESYFDEYYNMDFEDVISGVPCRFKYHSVEPNSYGLTTEEVLQAKDTELNRWYSLKKMMRYDQTSEMERNIRNNFENKASYPHVKFKCLPSLYQNPEEVQKQEEERRSKKTAKKRERKRKRAEKIRGAKAL